MILILFILEFFCGSLMFSYWIGLALGKNLKTVGDGNPGAFNLWRSAGYQWGLVGVALDFLKGYLPLVFLIQKGYVSGMEVALVAIAPILGHAFSPFMRMHGGKAIAVTFGVWSAVSGFQLSLVYAIILAILLIVFKLINKSTGKETDAVMVVGGMFFLGLYIFFCAYSPHLLILCFLNMGILFFTHRKELTDFFTHRVAH